MEDRCDPARGVVHGPRHEVTLSRWSGRAADTVSPSPHGPLSPLRESPACEIVVRLADELPEASIMAVEPNIDRLPDELEARDNVTLAEINEAVRAADIVLLLVDHTEFTRLDRALLTQKIVHDTRGVWG